MKKLLALVLAAAMFATLLSGCGNTASSAPAATEAPAAVEPTAEPPKAADPTAAPATEAPAAAVNTTTDVIGRVVEVPADASHVVVLPGPGLEKCMLLKATSRLAGIYKGSATAWAKLVAPEIENLTLFESTKTPGVENILALNAEYVFCHDYAELTPLLEEANIPYVVTQCAGALPYDDLEGFLAFQKAEVMAFADAFGGESAELGKAWCEYFDEKVAYVRERTDSIKDEDRPVVYYARSDEGLVTFSQNSYPHYLVELAGGYYIAKETPVEMNSTLTIEKIMEWDPDIIFMGRMNDTAIITENSAWSGITAVANGAVYLSPSGVFHWDYSGESVLLMLYLAKTIHPELFEDLDIAAEIRYYYETFYGYTLSDENVQRILNHQGPAV